MNNNVLGVLFDFHFEIWSYVDLRIFFSVCLRRREEKTLALFTCLNSLESGASLCFKKNEIETEFTWNDRDKKYVFFRTINHFEMKRRKKNCQEIST